MTNTSINLLEDGIRTSFVNPANINKIGESLSIKLRVDKHTASVIALKGI